MVDDSHNWDVLDRAVELLNEALGPFLEREIDIEKLNEAEDREDEVGRIIRSAKGLEPHLFEERIRTWDVAPQLNLMKLLWDPVFLRGRVRSEDKKTYEIKKGKLDRG